MTRYLQLSVACSFFLAAAVIALGGYYEGPGLLIAQVAFIVGPSLAPFLVLPKQGRLKLGAWIFIALLLTAGWSYVIYVDTRPYSGGGASFAVLFGWFTCFVAFILALLVSIFQPRFGGRR